MVLSVVALAVSAGGVVTGRRRSVRRTRLRRWVEAESLHPRGIGSPRSPAGSDGRLSVGGASPADWVLLAYRSGIPPR